MSELTFTELRNANQTRDAEFKCRIDGDQEWNIVDRSNELAGEVGELCNMAKKIRRQNLGMFKTDITKEHIKKEIADVLICLDLLAMDLDIDLGESVIKKFNESSDKFGLITKISTKTKRRNK